MRLSLLVPGLIGYAVVVSAQMPTATIAIGTIVGTTTTISPATNVVNQFIGVPFATTSARFTAPTDPAKLSAPLDTTSRKPACVQQFPYPEYAYERARTIYNTGALPVPPPEESEDCLYLNVFAPQSGASGKAVMVWFFGGNLMFGDASQPATDGSSIAANQDVIVVTVNYRTNAFGYLGSPEQTANETNAGYLDQRKGLDWVQKNIQAFGGDPKKVTIFGVSSGANSVKQLVASPPNPLPFRAAIIQSTANSGIPGSYVQAYNSLVNDTGCTAAASKLDCLRKVPATQIQDIVQMQTLFFVPVADGVTSQADITQNFYTGKSAKVPLMLGTTLQEGRSIGYIFGLTPGDTSMSSRDWLNSFMSMWFPGHLNLVPNIFGAYSSLANAPFEFGSQVLTDLLFTCGAHAIADIATSNGYDVWRYHSEAAQPNMIPFPDGGVFHASDTDLIFGTYNRDGATEQQVELSKYMQTAWANFVKNPSTGPGWPKLGSNGGKELQALGRNGSFGGTLDRQAKLDAICPLYALLTPIASL